MKWAANEAITQSNDISDGKGGESIKDTSDI